MDCATGVALRGLEFDDLDRDGSDRYTLCLDYETEEVFMSKAHRGHGIDELTRKNRGTCPVCKRTGIKLLYEIEAGEKKLTVCKQCKAAVAHGKKSEEIAAL